MQASEETFGYALAGQQCRPARSFFSTMIGWEPQAASWAAHPARLPPWPNLPTSGNTAVR